MNENNEMTTIKVSRQTRVRLGSMGNKEDTFDDIVCRLLDFYEKHNGEHQSN